MRERRRAGRKPRIGDWPGTVRRGPKRASSAARGRWPLRFNQGRLSGTQGRAALESHRDGGRRRADSTTEEGPGDSPSLGPFSLHPQSIDSPRLPTPHTPRAPVHKPPVHHRRVPLHQTRRAQRTRRHPRLPPTHTHPVQPVRALPARRAARTRRRVGNTRVVGGVVGHRWVRPRRLLRKRMPRDSKPGTPARAPDQKNTLSDLHPASSAQKQTPRAPFVPAGSQRSTNAGLTPRSGRPSARRTPPRGPRAPPGPPRSEPPTPRHGHA